ncbi:hypothetical protein E1211_17870 [Micromonospora sp. 15K316]|uniref:hypothetical protein n=1 Tax=Micromonospora sp. 15K316 TaxID=2530376 RepID=UPI001046A45F|nr:hypothetical protein [Micromonospora sp. 15K316]TDC34215.1 hypothetical protein E1211_17870 [Micromonospora sp. 15K316]
MTALFAELGALVHLLDSGRVPAPHGLHLNFLASDAAWVRAIAADPDTATQVGLDPHVIVAPGRLFNGTEYTEVRLSWTSDSDNPDRERMVAAVRALADLLRAGAMPVPLRLDAMHALTEVGLPAQRSVDQAATVLGERPVRLQGSVFVVSRLGRTVSYTVHGFEW